VFSHAKSISGEYKIYSSKSKVPSDGLHDPVGDLLKNLSSNGD
jgi:hypothetical protein